MVKPNYIQPDLFRFAVKVSEAKADRFALAESAVPPANDTDALLAEDDLKTAIDLLQLAEQVEDLALLELLTERQKQQVWAAVSPEVRERVKQIRAAATVPLEITAPFQTGDRIVLNAKPRLTTAELLAVFEVLTVEENQVQVRAKELGIRRYPVEWCVLYGRGEDLT